MQVFGNTARDKRITLALYDQRRRGHAIDALPMILLQNRAEHGQHHFARNARHGRGKVPRQLRAVGIAHDRCGKRRGPAGMILVDRPVDRIDIAILQPAPVIALVHVARRSADEDQLAEQGRFLERRQQADHRTQRVADENSRIARRQRATDLDKVIDVTFQAQIPGLVFEEVLPGRFGRTDMVEGDQREVLERHRPPGARPTDRFRGHWRSRSSALTGHFRKS